jgi:hypothetical protein
MAIDIQVLLVERKGGGGICWYIKCRKRDTASSSKTKKSRCYYKEQTKLQNLRDSTVADRNINLFH